MTRKEASRKENENKVWEYLYSEFGGKTLAPKFSIGDHARITKKKKIFDKGTLKDGRKRFSKFQKCKGPFQ